MGLYELLSKSDMVESKKVQYEDGTGWVVTSNSGGSGGSSSTTNSNIQKLNTSALEGLLKITDVLKESLTNINTGVSTYNYNNYNTYNYNSSNSSNNSSSTSGKNVNIPSSHVLYPGIVGILTTCSLLNNVPVNVIDGSKLTGAGATFFNNAKKWHTHTVYKSNNKSDGPIIGGVYELAYFDNTYFYKLPGSKPSTTYTNINNNFTINNVYIGKKEPIPLTGWPPPYIITPDINGLTKGQIKFKSKTTYVYTYNLKSIIPNPLFNKYINGRYDDDQYATGDLNGEINTSYLKLNKDNLSNEIPKGHYIPGIGELGISMENIQIINDSIEALGGEYSNYKIPYDAIIASSTLYSATPITNSNYTIANNINNVWAFNNNEAKISYMPISNKFTIIPFYRFENNVKINLEEDYDDIILNSIASTDNYDPNIYYELNSPITNFKINVKNVTNFTVNDWIEHPFNPKYFFNISFPEVRNYLTKDNNFTDLHNDYLSYYGYYNKYVKDDNEDPIISSYEQSNSYYMDIENNSYKMNFIWNNGVSFPTYFIEKYDYISYIPGNTNITGKLTYSSKYIKDEHKTISYSLVYIPIGRSPYTTYETTCQLGSNTDDFWKQILIYNVPIYNNHLVLTPIYGSGEKTYNFKKNKTKTLFYVTLPIQCTNFECKMNNTSDCTIYVSKYLELNGFTIYSINLDFKVDTPTDNVLIFSCNYQGKQIVKEYFYSIYSLLISNALYKDSSYTTYFGIENYYVAKDPYYWWKINKWDSLELKNSMRITNVQYLKYFDNDYDVNSRTVLYTFTDSFGKLFDQSFIKSNIKFIAYLTDGDVKINSYTYSYLEVTHSSYTSNTYTYSKYNNSFKKLSNAYFNGMYDMSYLINTISRNMDIKENGTVSDRGLRVDRLIDNDILNNSNKYDISNIENDNNPHYLIKNHKWENTYSPKYTRIYSYIYYEPKYELQYAIYKNIYEHRPLLKNNYHMFSINVNYFETAYSMPYWNLNSEAGVLYYKPIVRINRTVDDFGIYNDLIFAYMPKYYFTNLEYTNNYLSNAEAELKILRLYVDDANGSSNYVNKLIKIKKNDSEQSEQLLKIKFDPTGHAYPNNITPYLYNMKIPYQHYNNGNGSNGYLLQESTNLMTPKNINSKIKINIPIVGAKQSICLAMDMMKYVHIGLFRKVITDENGIILSKNDRTITSCTGINNEFNTTIGDHYFERGFDEVINIRNGNDVDEILKSTGWYYNITDSNMLRNIYWHMGNMYHNSFWFDYTYYYNYIFSDYIFLYNNINTTISVLISDPSLSLVSKQNAIIQLKPYELKVYYPSNFNYNDTSNFNKKKIYTIKVLNKTSKVSFMKFEHYKLGECNLSFEDMFDAFIDDNSDVINYFNTGNVNEINNVHPYPKFKLNGSMPDQLGYKLVTNLLGLYYNQNNTIHYTKDQILSFYNEIQKIGNRSTNTTGDNYSPTSQKIFEKLKANILSEKYNTLNIDIKNYSENNSGHLIIIESELEKNFNDNKKKTSIVDNIGNYSTYSGAFDDDGNFIYEYDINGASESNIINLGDDFL